MAHEPKHEEKAHLQLPLLVSSLVDVGRLIRELEVIDNAVLQSKLRDGDGEVKLPKTSHLMEQTLQLNKLNLSEDSHRQVLNLFLESIRKKAPTIHMSFSADPAPSFIEKIMAWLRREIDPQILLTVGMQPNIGAGTIVRTSNKQFDFSLRKDFENKRDMLVKSLGLPPEPAPVVHEEVPVASDNLEPVISMPQVQQSVPDSVPAPEPSPEPEPTPEAVPPPVPAPEDRNDESNSEEADS